MQNENDAIAAALTAKMSEAEGAEVAVQQAKQVDLIREEETSKG